MLHVVKPQSAPKKPEATALFAGDLVTYKGKELRIIALTKTKYDYTPLAYADADDQFAWADLSDGRSASVKELT